MTADARADRSQVSQRTETKSGSGLAVKSHNPGGNSGRRRGSLQPSAAHRFNRRNNRELGLHAIFDFNHHRYRLRDICLNSFSDIDHRQHLFRHNDPPGGRDDTRYKCLNRNRNSHYSAVHDDDTSGHVDLDPVDHLHYDHYNDTNLNVIHIGNNIDDIIDTIIYDNPIHNLVKSNF